MVRRLEAHLRRGTGHGGLGSVEMTLCGGAHQQLESKRIDTLSSKFDDPKPLSSRGFF